MNLTVTVGASVFTPYFTTGMSIVYVNPPGSRIGLVFNPTKLTCAECNTPIAEIAAGSLIIRSKHHGSRHTTVISKKEITQLL
jgi:hypothetical protein